MNEAGVDYHAVAVDGDRHGYHLFVARSGGGYECVLPHGPWSFTAEDARAAFDVGLSKATDRYEDHGTLPLAEALHRFPPKASQ